MNGDKCCYRNIWYGRRVSEVPKALLMRQDVKEKYQGMFNVLFQLPLLNMHIQQTYISTVCFSTCHMKRYHDLITKSNKAVPSYQYSMLSVFSTLFIHLCKWKLILTFVKVNTMP